MKIRCCTFFCFLLAVSHITFNSPEFKPATNYLAIYYRKYTVLLDSAPRNERGKVIFKGNKIY